MCFPVVPKVTQSQEVYLEKKGREMDQILHWTTNMGNGTVIWMDCVNKDMRAIRRTEDDIHDRTGWRRIVSAVHSDPIINWEWLEEEDDRSHTPYP